MGRGGGVGCSFKHYILSMPFLNISSVRLTMHYYDGQKRIQSEVGHFLRRQRFPSAIIWTCLDMIMKGLKMGH